MTRTTPAKATAAKTSRYIAVEGVIGVGKTTLAKRIGKSLAASVVLEVVEENPFLPRFYEDPESFSFQTQMFFLLSRYKQQLELSQRDLFEESIVADYIFAKDQIFATLNLGEAELALYRAYRPDLVIGDLRVGTRICYDAEYPAGFRAARRAGVQVMAIPSRDWRGIEGAHAAPVPYRASENGFAVVRATRGGRSLIVDPHGGIVAQADDGEDDVVLVAEVSVPGQSGATLYGRLGNWPPALAVTILVVVALSATLGRARSRSSRA